MSFEQPPQDWLFRHLGTLWYIKQPNIVRFARPCWETWLDPERDEEILEAQFYAEDKFILPTKGITHVWCSLNNLMTNLVVRTEERNLFSLSGTEAIDVSVQRTLVRRNINTVHGKSGLYGGDELCFWKGLRAHWGKHIEDAKGTVVAEWNAAQVELMGVVEELEERLKDVPIEKFDAMTLGLLRHRLKDMDIKARRYTDAQLKAFLDWQCTSETSY